MMADQENAFGPPTSPGVPETTELHGEAKPEKPTGSSTKSASSQTTYIQQVSVIIDYPHYLKNELTDLIEVHDLIDRRFRPRRLTFVPLIDMM